jgi:hypothetical protein
MRFLCFQLILIGLLEGVSFSAQASPPACPRIYSEQPLTYLTQPWKSDLKYEKYSDELDLNVMKEHHLSIGKDGRSLIGLFNGETKRLGEIRILKAKYLFKWTDQDFHEFLIATHGVSPEQMHTMLQHAGQHPGKGFYVSSDPFDSAFFGEFVHVYQPAKPLVILEYEMEIRPQLRDNPHFVKNLADAGIDGIRYSDYNENWLSVIDSRSIQRRVDFPRDVLSEYLIKPEARVRVVENLKKLPKAGIEISLDQRRQLDSP